MLLLVAAYAAWFAEPDTLSSIRGDAVSTLFYVSNWHFIVSDQGYFVHFGPPSPLLHTWSLAIEEQFYLVWPVVTLLVLRWGTRRTLAKVAALGAVASVALTWVLFAAGESTTRLYYGSDTWRRPSWSAPLWALSVRRPAGSAAIRVGRSGRPGAGRSPWSVSRAPWPLSGPSTR